MKDRKIQAFLLLAVIAGIWGSVVSRFDAFQKHQRVALLLGAGTATGALIALIIRAFL